jgi:hypothetical protein
MPNDYRKRWVTSFIYRIPVIPNLSRWARPILDGWESSAIINLQGGMPFSVFSSQNMNDGLNASRANLVSGKGSPNFPTDRRTINRWFNTDAFAIPDNFTWGNSAVNIVEGPGFSQVDLAVQKQFKVRESVTMLFRTEASNLFNRVNLGQPSSTIGSSTYGAIRSLSGDPRNLQMSLRVQF